MYIFFLFVQSNSIQMDVTKIIWSEIANVHIHCIQFIRSELLLWAFRFYFFFFFYSCGCLFIFHCLLFLLSFWAIKYHPPSHKIDHYKCICFENRRESWWLSEWSKTKTKNTSMKKIQQLKWRWRSSIWTVQSNKLLLQPLKV